jgi:hypothetical protein
MAMKAVPNGGHVSLARLARVRDCLGVSENVDGK